MAISVHTGDPIEFSEERIGSDPIELAVFKSVTHSIAEEMGASLRRTSFSPNIKERRDYSCAVFDGTGQVIAMGDHMPVHLGSMPMSVKAVIGAMKLGPGDVAILNDPYAGGTHLPDMLWTSSLLRKPLCSIWKQFLNEQVSPTEACFAMGKR